MKLGRYATLLALLANGCAVVGPIPLPPAKPVAVGNAPPKQTYDNGGIFKTPSAAYQFRPLFEDRRARYVGDVLTVVISERTQASKSSSAQAARKSRTDLSVSSIIKLPGKFGEGMSIAGGNDSTFTGNGQAAATNNFTGTLTVTIIEVLPNGNLVVRGDKEIAINQGTEVVRFSGVVNPETITAGNTVLSNVVANARLEYVGKGVNDEIQTMGWLQRFFLNISPF